MTKIFAKLLPHLHKGDLVCVGCSTSAVNGAWLGTTKGEEQSLDTAREIWNILSSVFIDNGINIAVQCCEHLNRAVVISKSAARGYKRVHAVPSSTAGGALASAAFENIADAVLVESVQAEAGIDIGGVMIGMQIKPVAVPINLNGAKIGDANVIAAYSRLPLIGGERTLY